MKIKRELRITAGVFLILMLASGAQAATVVLDQTDFMRGMDMGTFPFEIIVGGYFKPRLTDFESPAPFDVPVLAILKGLEIVGAPLLGSGMFNFQADPGISTADVNKVAGGGSVLSMPRLSDLGLSRLKVSDEPVPTIALLILVGLIALIALKGRRR